MLPKKVDEMLKNYRFCLGRCKYIEERLPRLKAEVEYLRNHVVEDTVSIGGQVMDGMPHGTEVGRPTERLGIKLVNGYEPPFLKEKEAELNELQRDYNEKIPTVVFVEAWLKGLKEDERWVIEKQVMDETSWRELIPQYSMKFGDSKSKYALRVIRDQALNKIYAMAS